MIKRLLRSLGNITPSFVHKVDTYLLTRHPLIWSLRPHFLAFYAGSCSLFFLFLVYAVPISPSSVYLPTYIAYFSIAFGIIGLGFWLYFQSQYNIQKNHGVYDRFFNLKYILMFAAIITMVTASAVLPGWFASKRVESYIFGSKIPVAIKEIERQVNPNSKSKYELSLVRYLRVLRYSNFFEMLNLDIRAKTELDRSIADIKKRLKTPSDPTKKSEALRVEMESHIESRKEFLRISNLLPLPKGQAGIYIKSGKVLRYKNLSYYHYHRTDARDSYWSRYFQGDIYVDKKKRIFSPETLVLLFLVDRANKLQYKKNPVDLRQITGSERLGQYTSDEENIYNLISQIGNTPSLYSLYIALEQDEYFWLIYVVSLSFCVFIIVICATTFNFLGAKALFVDTSVSISVVFVGVLAAIVMNDIRGVSSDESVIYASLSVLLLAVATTILLNRAIRRRKFTTMLWQISCFYIPSSFALAGIVIADEFLSSRELDAFAPKFFITLIFISVILYLPLQLRLMHKLYSLPR